MAKSQFRQGMHSPLSASVFGILPHCSLASLERMTVLRLQGNSTLGSMALYLQELLVTTTVTSLITPISAQCCFLWRDFLCFVQKEEFQHWKPHHLLTDFDPVFAYKEVRTVIPHRLCHTLVTFSFLVIQERTSSGVSVLLCSSSKI